MKTAAKKKKKREQITHTLNQLTMIDINAKKENCLARDKEFLSIYNYAFNS